MHETALDHSLDQPVRQVATVFFLGLAPLDLPHEVSQPTDMPSLSVYIDLQGLSGFSEVLILIHTHI